MKNSKQERINFIKEEWEKFLKKRNLTNQSYNENISKAKSPKQLKKIVGIQASIKRAIDEDEVILTEEEIQLITKEILSRAAFDEDEEYDSRLVRSFYKPTYFSYDVFDMIVNKSWEICENEHSMWNTEFEDFKIKIDYTYEKGYHLSDVTEGPRSPSLFRSWLNETNDE